MGKFLFWKVMCLYLEKILQNIITLLYLLYNIYSVIVRSIFKYATDVLIT